MDVNRQGFCPVCGYNIEIEFEELPWDNDSPSHQICPSCGIQYGYDDFAGGDKIRRAEIYKKWREDWVIDGMPWRSKGVKKPAEWDAKKQLTNIKY